MLLCDEDVDEVDERDVYLMVCWKEPLDTLEAEDCVELDELVDEYDDALLALE